MAICGACSNILVRLQHEKHRKGAYNFIKLSWETSAEVKTTDHDDADALNLPQSTGLLLAFVL